ncbi:MAG: kelch repeat-containing protein [Cytophagales bacterium]|nr:kelch repeat-containing protein [Cytophagales bacterium]
MNLWLSVTVSILTLTGSIQPTPCPRNQPVIAYHEQDRSFYLFGGYCSESKTRLNDLWKFDGQHWQLIEQDHSPEPRSGHTMIYDPTHRRLLLFGGKNDQGLLLNDLWEWKNGSWHLITESGPPARQSHRLVVNSSTGDLLLFGGSDVNRQAFGDTWIFNGETWLEKTDKAGPPARLQHTMTYDNTRAKVVLFGGFNRIGTEKIVLGDTWEWDHINGWVLASMNDHLARDHHAMTYDPNLKLTILFGGYHEGYLGDTWGWDGSNWRPLSQAIESGLTRRAGKPGLTYNTHIHRITLFGGWDHTNQPLMDWWYLDENEWKSLE